MQRNKLGHFAVGNTLNKGKNNPMYGKKQSEETIQKIKQSLKITNYKPTEELKKKISKANKGKKRTKEWIQKMIITRKNNDSYNCSAITKEKIRKKLIKLIERQKLNGEPLRPRVGKNESVILNNIEKQENIIIKRQYEIGGYFLDGYCKENNTAYEIDENHHFICETNINKDIERQKYITQRLNCNFIRIKDTEV